MNDIDLKRNDNGVGRYTTLISNNDPFDLTDATVVFLMNDLEIPVQVLDAKKGEVFVAFKRSHTSQAGNFDAEFEVRHKDDTNETIPNDGYIKVRILKDKGGR